MKRWVFIGLVLFGCEVRSERAQEQTKPTTAAPPPQPLSLQAPTEIKRAAPRPEEASIDYLKNGLAALWEGRLKDPEELVRWFVPGESSTIAVEQILRDQPRDGSIKLLDAVITGVHPLTASMVEVDYFISTTTNGGLRCYRGTHQWLQQPDGRWLRNTTSTLIDAPDCAAEKGSPP